MGQTISQDLPCAGISVSRARVRSSNGPLTQARYHNKCGFRLGDHYSVDGKAVVPPSKYSSVLMVTSRSTGRKCALKAFCKHTMTDTELRLMTAEVEIHLTLDHPNVARVYDMYENDNAVHMVMEFCSGGELFSELVHKNKFTDQEAAGATWHLLSAVCYLHSHHVVHRDLKLENCLFADADKRILKLIDFGFATVCGESDQMQASCGSRDYISPEALKGKGYTNKCDMWSIGVIVFMMLTGHAPIRARRRSEILQTKIIRGQVDWSILAKLGTVSQEAEAFLRSLLTLDQDARMDASTALCHPWLSSVRAKAHIEGIMRITPGILRSLLGYTCAPPLRRAALQLVAQQLLGQGDLRELTELFLALTDSSTATIHLEQLQHGIEPDMQLLDAMDMNREGSCRCLDVNQDGEVYFSEFIAATVSSLGKLPEQALHAAFARLDTRSRGKVGVEDFLAVFGDTVEGADSGNLLGDYLIDFETFKEVVHGDREQHGATGGNHLEVAAAPSLPVPPCTVKPPRAPADDLIDSETFKEVVHGDREQHGATRGDHLEVAAAPGLPVLPCAVEPPRAPADRSPEGGGTPSTDLPLDAEPPGGREEQLPQGQGSNDPSKLPHWLITRNFP